jgi:hypothetical protein
MTAYNVPLSLSPSETLTATVMATAVIAAAAADIIKANMRVDFFFIIV